MDIDAVWRHLPEEFMERCFWSPFPVPSTEHLDSSWGLLGPGGALVDNTPFVLLVPMTFPLFLHEDYYSIFFFSAGRFIAPNILTFASFFVYSHCTFHQECCPPPALPGGRKGKGPLAFWKHS